MIGYEGREGGRANVAEVDEDGRGRHDREGPWGGILVGASERRCREGGRSEVTKTKMHGKRTMGSATLKRHNSNGGGGCCDACAGQRWWFRVYASERQRGHGPKREKILKMRILAAGALCCNSGGINKCEWVYGGHRMARGCTRSKIGALSR